MLTGGTAAKSGWVAGGGLEYAWTNAWTIRAEYLHYDLAGDIFTGPRSPTSPPFGVQYSVDRNRIDVIRAAQNFKFGP